MLLNDKDKARGNSLVLQLYSFPSSNISLVIDFLRAKGIKDMAVPATGGGGHKHAALFAEELGVTLQTNDEMRSVITGKKKKYPNFEKTATTPATPATTLITDPCCRPLTKTKKLASFK